MSAPTSYALKYGTFPGGPPGSGKSGLTPIGPAFYNAQSTTQAIRDESEKYQRKVLMGYTSQDLQELDCLTNRQLKPIDLTNQIWPIFQQNKWVPENNPVYDLRESTLGPDQYGNARLGTIAWDANEPKIWKHLEPCLRLSCQILSRLESLPWFDALLAGTLQATPDDRFSFEDLIRMDKVERLRYKQFQPRTQDERLKGPSSADVLRTLISDVLVPRLKLGFVYKETNSLLGGPPVNPNNASYPLGSTASCKGGDIYIFLSCQSFIPLIREDLSSNERLLQTSQIAVTIVHEFVHAIWYAIDNYQNGTFIAHEYPEPYYQQEQKNELGHSLEQALFGDDLVQEMDREHLPIVERAAAPSIALFAKKFPTVLARSKFPILINPAITSPALIHPIPVTFYENLNSDAFWDVQVRSMGLKAVQLPKATSTVYYDTVKGAWIPVRGDLANCEEYMRKIEARETMRLANLTPAERKEHARVTRENLVALYQPLTVERNLKVHSIREQSDIISVTYESDPMAPTIMANLVPLLEQLWDIHKQICGLLSTMEKEAGLLLDTRNSISSFHDDFRIFVSTFLPCPWSDLHDRLMKIISNLDKIVPPAYPGQQQAASPQAPIPTPTLTPAAGGSFVNLQPSVVPYINMSSPTIQLPPLPPPQPLPDYDDILDQALAAIDDKDVLGPLCEQIMNSLLAQPHIHAVARILYATTGTATAQKKHTEICMAMNYLNNIPVQNRTCFRAPITYESVIQMGTTLHIQSMHAYWAAQKAAITTTHC
ncbi:uncharacterized protein RSE6_13170 [Rhynchosporium secalis]|uniref:Uncharacterized protein n=1 Tax=Rhynchosporium secalis TaxID=38038 RepID=A0A1E1MS71_RHYSE|nr:uncharacterized protein RSE6_13170 [Rhynchosporium secalis]